jgi:prevent-host-death family protein
MTIMVIRDGVSVGVAEAKAKLSELLERVAAGERITVSRRGRPAAVLAPPDADFEREGPHAGLATLAGVLADRPEFDDDMRAVVRSRRSARDRAVPDLR